jgi:anti-sigma B factor antagonist
MEIAVAQHDDVRVVSGIGSLDAATSPQVLTVLEDELEQGSTKMVIDLSDVGYLSSAGLRVILIALRNARSAGGDLRLAGAEGNIQRVLKISGFDTILDSFPTSEEAVASFRP